MLELAALARTLERAFARNPADEIDTCVVYLQSPKQLADAIGHITHVEFPRRIEKWIEEYIHAGMRHRVAMFSWILEDASARDVIENVRQRRSELDAILARCLVEDGYSLEFAQQVLRENDLGPAATPLGFRVGPSGDPIVGRLEVALDPYHTGFFDPNWPTMIEV